MHHNAKLRRHAYFNYIHQSWCIPLTAGVVALVDPADVSELSQFNWYAARGAQGWVAQRNSRGANRRTILMHISIMTPPEDKYIDHKIHRPHSENIVDNRRSNLRICGMTENQRNQRPKRVAGRTSKFKGVYWRTYGRGPAGRWIASISINGEVRTIGRFTDEREAALNYDNAAIALFGEFALTNKSLGLLHQASM